MRVLLIEDDEMIGDAVRSHIASSGHAVDWARTIGSAAEHLSVGDYALVLLDLQLPDGSGLPFLKGLRQDGHRMPVIVVTARDQISDRIEGLNNGADDYLVKPFDLGELSARMGAVARRTAGRPDPLLTLGPVVIDMANRSVVVDGASVDLTAREWAVLDRLALRPGAVISKAQIEDALYAFGSEVESNTVEVYVSRLRRKIGASAVQTVRGVGYRLTAP
ncbi:response regulator [Mesorhizobium marinum]|uniref:Response regulator n=1 Tax=Mesorhizobium marinum TaxID=3228790 RepID=A0ABV3R653_9HYPH